MASNPYLSQIQIFAFNFAPRGWAQCNGQILPINQNQALFSLLGTTYGGNGQTNFSLPNLQGRVPFHMGNNFTIGNVGGEENHTLTLQELPSHTHQVVGSSNTPNAATPAGNFFASNSGYIAYNSTTNETMNPAAVSSSGGNPHNNMSPYTTLNICIALQGIFPSRN